MLSMYLLSELSKELCCSWGKTQPLGYAIQGMQPWLLTLIVINCQSNLHAWLLLTYRTPNIWHKNITKCYQDNVRTMLRIKKETTPRVRVNFIFQMLESLAGITLCWRGTDHYQHYGINSWPLPFEEYNVPYFYWTSLGSSSILYW
jgi:hypothetical protein